MAEKIRSEDTRENIGETSGKEIPANTEAGEQDLAPEVPPVPSEEPVSSTEVEDLFDRLVKEAEKNAETPTVPENPQVKESAPEAKTPETPEPVTDDLGEMLKSLSIPEIATPGEAANPESVEVQPEHIPAEAGNEHETVEKGSEFTSEEKIALEADLISTFSDFIEKVKYRESSGELLISDKEQAQPLFEHAAGDFKSITGKDFEEEIRNRTRDELTAKGYKIISKEEYSGKEHKDKLREKVQQGVWSVGVKSAWNSLSDAEKASAKSEQDFALKLEYDRHVLEDRGFHLSPDVYYNFFRDGVDPRTIKEKGFFSKKIEIGKLGGGKVQMKKGDLSALMEDTQNKMDAYMDKRVDDRLYKGYREAKSRWLKTKLKHAGDLIVEATPDYIEDDVKKAVKFETITPEKEVQEEYEMRLAKLDGISKEIASDTSLEDEQRKTLQDAMDAKRVKIEKTRTDKLNKIKAQRLGKQKKTVVQRIAEISAI